MATTRWTTESWNCKFQPLMVVRRSSIWRLIKVLKVNSKTMKKIITQILGIHTHIWPPTDNIVTKMVTKSVYTELLTDAANIKPITSSIYTWEQPLIDLKVTLPNFMVRKNKHEIHNCQWITNQNNSKNISVKLMFVLFNDSWTKCLNGCFWQDQMSCEG